MYIEVVVCIIYMDRQKYNYKKKNMLKNIVYNRMRLTVKWVKYDAILNHGMRMDSEDGWAYKSGKARNVISGSQDSPPHPRPYVTRPTSQQLLIYQIILPYKETNPFALFLLSFSASSRRLRRFLGFPGPPLHTNALAVGVISVSTCFIYSFLMNESATWASLVSRID